MSVLSTGARVQKLRSMTAAELVARARYRMVVAMERAQHRRGRLAPESRLASALRTDLHGPGWERRLVAARLSQRPPLLPGAMHRQAMRELFARRYERERRETLAQAERARQHEFEFFGQQFKYAAEIDWHADPVTGKRWPEVFHADVPVHGGDSGYGDVKHVWELSRQQYLIDLAKAWFLTESRPDLDAMQRLVSSWIAGNPYATGVNWACALEPAFRVWSWLWAYYLTVDSIDEAFHLHWLLSFYDHARFLARHLEHYSSPYNHLIGEASALYTLAICFPEFRDSRKWRRLGRAVLEGRLREQFYGDGGSVEQSTFYHHATTGFYLLAALIGRENRADLSEDVWNALERALDFSMHLTQPDGRTPEIGGADDGKPIRMEHLPFWDFRPYLAAGAVLFSRPEYKAVARRFHEDALWLLGPEGLRAFDALGASPPRSTRVLLAASGYAVDRSDWSERADYVCFDVGEQAAGMRSDGVPNSMHGHADCLSVIMWLGGRRVLVDSGLYAYNCGGEWEAHFRETAAHSTARVDGRDQARHIGKMAWSYSYRPTIEGRFADSRQAWTLASHDGFARGPYGLTHRRAVWCRPDGYVVVYDEFVGTGRHDLEVNWQFAPGTVELGVNARATFDGIADLVWVGNSEWTAEARCGGSGPADGWICSSLGVRRPSPRLTLRSTMTDGSRAGLLTVIANRAETRSRIAGTDARGVLVVAGDGFTDWIAAPAVGSGGPIDTDAFVAICRMAEADGELERMMIGGTYLRVDAAVLAQLGGELLCAP